MPLKLNIAMSRKVGAPNYGSRGATVGLEMEVDSSLVDHPRQLHERIARLFRLAKQSVDRELMSPEPVGSKPTGKACDQEPPDRPATDRQIRAIQVIASRQNLNLTHELQGRFGIDRPEDLSLDDASQLIDAIKPSTNGAVGKT